MRRRLLVGLGAGWRLALMVVVIAAIAIVPLLLVYRSECPDEGGTETRWSFVPPFDDPPGECHDHQTGLEVIGDELGL